MSPDQALGVLADFRSAMPMDDLWVIVNDLVEENVLTVEEVREADRMLGHLVVEGEASPEVVEAFHITVEDIRRRVEEAEARTRPEVAKHGARAVGATVDDTNWIAFSAYMNVCEELNQPGKVAPVGDVLIRNPRARESRPRSRSTRGGGSSSGSRDDDDPHLADVPRACPRCGCVPRSLAPRSALWTCDFCADVIWEQLVQHDLERVLAEAESILRGAA